VKSVAALVFVVLTLSLVGCGGGSGSSNSTVTVTVSPSTATVVVGSTKQFTAKVSGSSNSDVTWNVNGINGGDASYGAISGSGLYSAPATITTSTSVTVTAISVSDPSKTADAKVTIANPMSISPETVSVRAGNTQQFTASVNFSTNTGVVWEVNGVPGGNSTVGTITTSGSFTAPNAVPSPSTVTVTALSKADSSHAVASTVEITPPDLVISPTSVTVAAAAKQTFTATVLSTAAHPTWSVSCRSTASGACGTIDDNGVFTAPVTPPRGAEVSITASMLDGSANSDSTAATIQFSNASLSGNYVFEIGGVSATTLQSIVGTLICDGAGHITGGVIDRTDAPGTPIQVTGGTYQIGTDGRGSVTVLSSSSTLNLKLALANNAEGVLVDTDSEVNATGRIFLQQSPQPPTSGNHIIAFAGNSLDGSRLVQSVGALVFDSTGAISGGILDSTDNTLAKTETVTGGAIVGPNDGSRAVLNVATSSGSHSFAYYAVDSERGLLISIDGSGTSLGELTSSAVSPTMNSSLARKYTFSMHGMHNGAPFGITGTISMSTAGSITNILFDGLPQTVFDLNLGAFSIKDPVTGRSTATWTANSGEQLKYVFYPKKDGTLAMLETDGLYAAHGEAKPFDDTLNSNVMSFGGSFVLCMYGSDGSTNAAVALVGRTTPYWSTASSTFSGTIDGTVGAQASLGMVLTNFNATTQRYEFGVSATNLSTGPFEIYWTNTDRAFAVLSNGSTVISGELIRQY
jgi:hypothetical protein